MSISPLCAVSISCSLCAFSISRCVRGSNSWSHAFRRGKRDGEEERGTLLEGWAWPQTCVCVCVRVCVPWGRARDGHQLGQHSTAACRHVITMLVPHYNVGKPPCVRPAHTVRSFVRACAPVLPHACLCARAAVCACALLCACARAPLLVPVRVLCGCRCMQWRPRMRMACAQPCVGVTRDLR